SPVDMTLQRVAGAGSRIFATDVSDIQFQDSTIDLALAIDELRIIVTVSKTTPQQKTAEITVSSIVALRN
ncbi:hypothetical protein ACFL38_05590, partial [Candidatus Omnitrophota bacterium]